MKTLARDDCRAEIRRRLRTVRPESTPRWGKMSAHQMVCHLADACRMATGEKIVAPVRGALPPGVVKWIALYLPLPWPKGIPTLPELDQQGGGTRPVDFPADLARVEASLNALVTGSVAGEGWPHPVFGAMSRADWLRWGYLHTAHHLRQFGA
jgi:hypothetical protein